MQLITPDLVGGPLNCFPTEMAPLFNLHRNDRYSSPQLCRTRRHARFDRRGVVHFGGSAHHRLLLRRFRLQRVEVEV